MVTERGPAVPSAPGAVLCKEVNISLKLMPIVHPYLFSSSVQIPVSTHSVGCFNGWGLPLVAAPLFSLNVSGGLTAIKSL